MMPINVTEAVNNFVQNNSAATEKQKQGASTASAFFSALEGDNLNASSILNSNPLNGGLNRPDINAALSKVNLDEATKSVAPAQAKEKVSDNQGPEKAENDIFSKGVNRAILDLPDSPIGAPTIKVNDKVPILLQSEVRALMCQIGFIETDWVTEYYASPKFGRYGVHTKTLTYYEYLDKSGNWTGKEGITSDADFIFDSNVQDRVMEKFIQDQYAALIRNKGIRDFDTKETIAGMIAVAYQFQDANPSLSSLNAITGLAFDPQSLGDVGAIVADTSTLTNTMNNTLAGGIEGLASTGTVAGADSVLSSTADSLTSTLAGSNLPNSLQASLPSVKTALEANDPAAAKTALSNSSLLENFKSTALSIKENMKPIADKVSGLSDSIKKKLQEQSTSTKAGLENYKQMVAQKINVDKLKSSASAMATAIPADKAKQWRLNGTEKDSQGRNGTFYYNAGRYAVSGLSADVEI